MPHPRGESDVDDSSTIPKSEESAAFAEADVASSRATGSESEVDFGEVVDMESNLEGVVEDTL
jgi:hypothetical protein